MSWESANWIFFSVFYFSGHFNPVSPCSFFFLNLVSILFAMTLYTYNLLFSSWVLHCLNTENTHYIQQKQTNKKPHLYLLTSQPDNCPLAPTSRSHSVLSGATKQTFHRPCPISLTISVILFFTLNSLFSIRDQNKTHWFTLFVLTLCLPKKVPKDSIAQVFTEHQGPGWLSLSFWHNSEPSERRASAKQLPTADWLVGLILIVTHSGKPTHCENHHSPGKRPLDSIPEES